MSIDFFDSWLILSYLSQIPNQIQQNPFADYIHQFFINQTELSRVERNNLANDWLRECWNIASRQLTSAQRTRLFSLANEKIDHRKLLFVVRRVDDGKCPHSRNGRNHTFETLDHKFFGYARVAPAWAALQQRLTRILGGWRWLDFEDPIKPALAGINRRCRYKILKLS